MMYPISVILYILVFCFEFLYLITLIIIEVLFLGVIKEDLITQNELQQNFYPNPFGQLK